MFRNNYTITWYINLYCNIYYRFVSIWDEKEHLNFDSIDHSKANDNDVFEQLTPRFFICLKIYRFSNHSIKLKVHTTIILLKTLDSTEGLCNGM